MDKKYKLIQINFHSIPSVSELRIQMIQICHLKKHYLYK